MSAPGAGPPSTPTRAGRDSAPAIPSTRLTDASSALPLRRVNIASPSVNETVVFRQGAPAQDSLDLYVPTRTSSPSRSPNDTMSTPPPSPTIAIAEDVPTERILQILILNFKLHCRAIKLFSSLFSISTNQEVK